MLRYLFLLKLRLLVDQVSQERPLPARYRYRYEEGKSKGLHEERLCA